MRNRDMGILQKFASSKYKFIVFLLVLPAILGAIYVKIFGVNVVFWDQWELVPLIEKLYSGNLTFDQLFAQHNEHRLFFPRIIMLILAHITRYNTITEMYLSWIITLLTLVLIFVMYKQNFGISESSLLKFIPISWLIFNFRQFENMLWGWQNQIYLCVFGFVFSIYLLEKSEKIDCKFLLAIFGGILSSFSFVNGLLVWPTGFLFIILSKTKNKNYLGTAWALVGIAVLCTYLYKWVKPSHHPSILYIIEQPINSIEYLIVNIGSPLGFEHSTAFGMGIFILFEIIMVSILLLKNGLLKENAKWLSFIFFSLASSLTITVGRAGFGVEQALSSRYVTFTLLGIVGLYLVVVGLYNKFETKNQKYAVLYGMVLSVIFVGIIIGYSRGVIAGEEISESRKNMACYLIGYNWTSDEFLKNLYPHPDIVKKRAKILERHKLNVFSFKDEVYMLYDLKPIKILSQQHSITGAGKINDEIKFIIHEHPLPSDKALIEFENIPIPKNATLRFSIALDPQVWSPDKGDGVLFEIYIKENESKQQIFSKYIDPKNNPEERKWNDSEVDLSNYADKNVTIIFSTSSGPNNDSNYDWAWWGNPVIVTV